MTRWGCRAIGNRKWLVRAILAEKISCMDVWAFFRSSLIPSLISAQEFFFKHFQPLGKRCANLRIPAADYFDDAVQQRSETTDTVEKEEAIIDNRKSQGESQGWETTFPPT